MGKRSNFERRPADFYPTPKAAVAPLIPYLRNSGIRTFAEPCVGDGDLLRHLESFGLRCVYAGDAAARMRLRSIITARPMRSLRTRPTPAS